MSLEKIHHKTAKYHRSKIEPCIMHISDLHPACEFTTTNIGISINKKITNY